MHLAEPRKWDKQTNSQYQTKTDKHKETINSLNGLYSILKIELSAFSSYLSVYDMLSLQIQIEV